MRLAGIGLRIVRPDPTVFIETFLRERVITKPSVYPTGRASIITRIHLLSALGRLEGLLPPVHPPEAKPKVREELSVIGPSLRGESKLCQAAVVVARYRIILTPGEMNVGRSWRQRLRFFGCFPRRS